VPALPAAAAPEGPPVPATGAHEATADEDAGGQDAAERTTHASPEATPEPAPAAGLSLAGSPAELFMAHTNGAAS
jgi:hypothetical protein